ncbi:MAG: sigma-54-dependent transcriptional regulator [Bradymonadia bacterium]
MAHRVLIADDDPTLRELLAEIMADDGYETHTVSDGDQAIAALVERRPDLVLTDLRMPGVDGLRVVDAARRCDPPVPVIVLTAYGSVPKAVEAMRRGAFDFVTKPIESPRALRDLAARALATAQVDGASTQTAPPTAPTQRSGSAREMHERTAASGPIFHDPASRQLLTLIRKVAARDTTILLSGESGAGKEVVARQIHDHSPRHGGPFVALNCGAIPDSLFESQLFGHVKGAFTGAHADRSGVFEDADGGTLLLDEVADLSAQAQVKLLRALELRRITRVGESVERAVDVRLVAASHKDLKTEVQSGRFREDLYYRLSVFPLEVPPLRSRPGDIEPLAEGFLRQLDEGDRGITEAARAVMLSYGWPGNVRQLRNVMERAVILAGDGPIGPEHLGLEGVAVTALSGKTGTSEAGTSEAAISSTSAPKGEEEGAEGASLKDMERQAILDALEAHDGNRRKAADALGIALRTLQYKLKSYGMTKK